MSNPCGCVPASFVVVGQTEAGWLKRCDGHKNEDMRRAIESSEAEGWTHFEVGGDGSRLNVDEAMEAITHRHARIDRRKDGIRT